MSEIIQVSGIPFTLSVTLSRTVSALDVRAATRERERAALHLLTTAALARQAFPRHACKTQRRKAAERSSVICELNEREFLLPVPAGCIRARAVHSSAVRLRLPLVFLFSPLLPLTSFLAFSIFRTVSLLLVWQLKTLLW